MLCLKAAEFWKGGGATPGEVGAALHDLCEKAGAGQVRVVIGLRRQDAWLASWYAHFSQWFRHFSHEDFERRMTRSYLQDARCGARSWLLHDQVAESFHGIFGKDKVMFVSMEEIGADPEREIARLQDFVEVPLLPAYRASRSSGADMTPNKISTASDEWALHRQGGTLRLAPEIPDRIQPLYAESNDRFTKITGHASGR